MEADATPLLKFIKDNQQESIGHSHLSEGV